MAIVTSPGVTEIAVQMTVAGGRQAVNVWHMRADDVGEDPSPLEVVEDFANNWQDHMMNLPTADVVLTGFSWVSLNSADGQTGTLLPDPAKTTIGAGGADGEPPNCALLLTKQTSGGRGTRNGRCYIPQPPQANVFDDGTLSAAYLAQAQAECDDFLSGITDTGTFSRVRYPVVLNTTPAARAPGTAVVAVGSSRVTAIVPDARLATQRRRLRG